MLTWKLVFFSTLAVFLYVYRLEVRLQDAFNNKAKKNMQFSNSIPITAQLTMKPQTALHLTWFLFSIWFWNFIFFSFFLFFRARTARVFVLLFHICGLQPIFLIENFLFAGRARNFKDYQASSFWALLLRNTQTWFAIHRRCKLTKISLHALHPSPSSTACFPQIPKPVSHLLTLWAFLRVKNCGLLSFPKKTILQQGCMALQLQSSSQPKGQNDDQEEKLGDQTAAQLLVLAFTGYSKNHLMLHLNEAEFERNQEIGTNSSRPFKSSWQFTDAALLHCAACFQRRGKQRTSWRLHFEVCHSCQLQSAYSSSPSHFAAVRKSKQKEKQTSEHSVNIHGARTPQPC